LNGSLDASLLFLISENIFEDFRGCQFLNQHPILANTNDSHGATEHFVWSSTFDPKNKDNPYNSESIPFLLQKAIWQKELYFQRLLKCLCHASIIFILCFSTSF
jgi:hypothetical protein